MLFVLRQEAHRVKHRLEGPEFQGQREAVDLLRLLLLHSDQRLHVLHLLLASQLPLRLQLSRSFLRGLLLVHGSGGTGLHSPLDASPDPHLLVAIGLIQRDPFIPGTRIEAIQALPALTDQRALIPKRLHLERGPLKELHRFLEHPHCYEGLEDFLVGHHDIHLLHLEELVVPATLLPKGIRAPLVQVIILVVLLPILYQLLVLEVQGVILAAFDLPHFCRLLELLHPHTHGGIVHMRAGWDEVSQAVEGEMQRGLLELREVALGVEVLLGHRPHLDGRQVRPELGVQQLEPDQHLAHGDAAIIAPIKLYPLRLQAVWLPPAHVVLVAHVLIGAHGLAHICIHTHSENGFAVHQRHGDRLHGRRLLRVI
mmetsp:Transcript_70503/g.168316  ORF Transcript_70503/g.168316 Transcript_70503/m.168316 type:complete len:369 (+) Transcript_70503:1841-2947(+)